MWVQVPFNNAIQPGPKTFDIDLNQVSYSADRAQAVDLSDGYFNNNQAVVAFKGTAIAKATTVAELKNFRLGTQVGTTSLAYIQNNIQPTVAAPRLQHAGRRDRRPSRPTRSTASSPTSGPRTSSATSRSTTA